jgi:hypothetical protein
VVLHGGPEAPDELARDGDDGHLRLLAVGEHRRGVHRDAAEALHAADGFARRGAGRELLGLGVRRVAALELVLAGPEVLAEDEVVLASPGRSAGCRRGSGPACRPGARRR